MMIDGLSFQSFDFCFKLLLFSFIIVLLSI